METSHRPLVVYTQRVPSVGPDMLRAHCEVSENSSDDVLTHTDIIARASAAQALCFFVPDLIDAALIARLPNLKILAGFGKGYDNVDVAAATARGIWVSNVPDALTVGTADLAFGLVIALARKIVQGDAVVRSGAFRGWHPTRLLGTSVTGRTLGIIGFGAIGRAVAERARGFDMRVLTTDVAAIDPSAAAALHARVVERDRLLEQSDIVVLAAPLESETRAMIGAAELACMAPGALLINPARGSLVDEAAIADALERGTLGGYAADVFSFEDRQFSDAPTGIEPRLLAQRERTLFTPHIGTALADAREELARVQARCVLQALAGERPTSAVNVLATL